MDSSTNNNSNNNNKQRAFNYEDYEVQFVEMMECSESRELFLNYVKQYSIHEMIEFLNKSQDYRKEIGIAYDKKEIDTLTLTKCEIPKNLKHIDTILTEAKEIINQFIMPNGKYPLNVSCHIRDKTIRRYNYYSNFSSNLSEYIISLNDESEQRKIWKELVNLFDDIECTILHDLQYNYFSKFKTSETLTSFLKKKGPEFTKLIAINTKIGFGIDIRYKPEDFITTNLSEKDIYFAFTLAEDSPDWTLIYDDTLKINYNNNNDKENNKLSVPVLGFTSRHSYALGNANPNTMRIGKVIAELPFDYREVYRMFSDKEGRLALEGVMSDCELHKHVPVNTENNPLSYSYTSFALKPLKILTVRDFILVQTTIYDEKLDCIVTIGKSAQYEERNPKKGRILANILYFHLFYNIGENRTRYMNIFYSLLNLPMMTNFVFNSIVTQRCKTLISGMVKELIQNTDSTSGKYKENSNSFNELFCQLQCLKENSEAYPERSCSVPVLGCSLQYIKNPADFLTQLQKEKNNTIYTLKLTNTYLTMSNLNCKNFTNLFYLSKENTVSLYQVFNDFFQVILPINLHKMKTFSSDAMKMLKIKKHKIFPKLDVYIDVMFEQINKFFNKEMIDEEGEVDFMTLLPELVLLINASCIVAKELGQTEYSIELIKLFNDMNKGLEGIALFLPKYLQKLMPNKREENDLLTTTTDLLQILWDELVEELKKKKEYKEKTNKEIMDSIILGKEKDLFYSLTAKLMVSIYAGSTVFKSSAYSILALLDNPNCKEKVIGEINQIIDNFNNEFNTKLTRSNCFKDIQFISYFVKHSNYLLNCVKETLRRYTGPIVLRKLMKPTVIEENGEKYLLKPERNHLLALSPYLFHHDERIYPEPFKFIPERFEENSKFKDLSNPLINYNNGFHAFGAGNHVCLGTNVAYIESCVIVGKVLSEFDLTLKSELSPPDYTIIGIAKPTKPCLVLYKKINNFFHQQQVDQINNNQDHTNI
ncbi:hypothetical protein ABK040_005383 [Willaertia magna]